MIRRLFLDHPASVRETYFEHMGVAFRFGGRLLAAGAAAVVHGIVPAWHERTASKAVKTLHAELAARQPAPARDDQWLPEYEI
jgi:hypothetical protein